MAGPVSALKALLSNNCDKIMFKIFIFLSITGIISAKRCRHRKNTGFSCKATCDYTTGELKDGCVQYTLDWDLLETGGSLREARKETPYPGCLTVTNKPCVFPITIEGQEYKSCIMVNKNIKPRCATVVEYDEEGQNNKILDWEYCHTECPFEKVKNESIGLSNGHARE